MAAQMRAQLIERARNGDREAFGQLAAGEVDRLIAIARLILRDQDLAEDAVQEALVRCWRQLPRLRDIDAFDAWLYQVVVHATADELRRHRRFQSRVTDLDVEPADDDAAQLIADRELLEQGFRRLSIDHRAVIVLHHYQGLSLNDVAEALGIPAGTAKSRYHYAMAALRAALDAEARTISRTEVLA
jgi:RNA polymerase sigma-70 factor, ECF subfamily